MPGCGAEISLERCLCFDMSVQAGWNLGPVQYWGVIFPGVITAVGIFLMRQLFDGIPNELLDAARIDGMHEFGIFYLK